MKRYAITLVVVTLFAAGSGSRHMGLLEHESGRRPRQVDCCLQDAWRHPPRMQFLSRRSVRKRSGLQ